MISQDENSCLRWGEVIKPFGFEVENKLCIKCFLGYGERLSMGRHVCQQMSTNIGYEAYTDSLMKWSERWQRGRKEIQLCNVFHE